MLKGHKFDTTSITALDQGYTDIKHNKGQVLPFLKRINLYNIRNIDVKKLMGK